MGWMNDFDNRNRPTDADSNSDSDFDAELYGFELRWKQWLEFEAWGREKLERVRRCRKRMRKAGRFCSRRKEGEV